LQSELLSFLAADVPCNAAATALEALVAVSSSAVLAPVQALPPLLSECLVGARCDRSVAQRLILRLVSVDMQSLPECFLAGVHEIAEVLARRDAGPEGFFASFCGKPPILTVIRTQLCKDLVHTCIVRLMTGLVSLCEPDYVGSLVSSPMLAAIFFGFLVGLIPDYATSLTCTASFPSMRSMQEEPSVAECAVSLVLSALARPTLYEDDSQHATDAVSHVALALEDLDLLDADDAAGTAHQRMRLSMWRKRYLDFSVGSGSDEASDRTPAVDKAASVGSKAVVDIPRASPEAMVCEEIKALPDYLQIPWYAKYDASCDQWRCTLCARSGGRNPYAKGIHIHPSQVALRMRIHAKSAVHQRAELAHGGKEEVPGHAECGTDQVRKPASLSMDNQHAAKRRCLSNQPCEHDRSSCQIDATTLPTDNMPTNQKISQRQSSAKISEPWKQLEALCGKSKLGGA